MQICLPAFAILILASCARTSVMPMAEDTIQITTSAAPVCGQAGAQKVAVTSAAIETITRGFDKFYVLGAGHENNVRVVGTTPLVSNTNGNFSAYAYGNMLQGYGSSTTYTTGGQPIIGGSNDQGLVIKMLKNGGPGAGNAVDARAQLGPDWQKIIAEGIPNTCQ